MKHMTSLKLRELDDIACFMTETRETGEGSIPYTSYTSLWMATQFICKCTGHHEHHPDLQSATLYFEHSFPAQQKKKKKSNPDNPRPGSIPCSRTRKEWALRLSQVFFRFRKTRKIIQLQSRHRLPNWADRRTKVYSTGCQFHFNKFAVRIGTSTVTDSYLIFPTLHCSSENEFDN